ncbi:hypothetical protein [Cellulomonas xiejunii]|uniref:Uncharacterized protein n=1 Tax=Cellulomonas xiejunii TaxID=2968083 RepID=A0ABY5KPP5_9CELL|nr:hypothetical protein [Cellulomonas xiejunii]MCC2321149.1 hypothetical protein [Cellulomonas xiejunii]UUI71739.1 hypothetical protein NP048_18440 [Cellulomonas xiejunii]
MPSTWRARLFGDRQDPRRRLHALFGGPEPAAGQPPVRATEWARGVLDGRGSGRPLDTTTVTRQLREAEPRLTLRAATFLAEHVTRR